MPPRILVSDIENTRIEHREFPANQTFEGKTHGEFPANQTFEGKTHGEFPANKTFEG